ncbi:MULTISPECIES: TetR/AcrR family transcriptional regulator [unclassified Nocardia]
MILGSDISAGRLRPGPAGQGGLSREEVSKSQRGRLALAAVSAVGEVGYGPTTIGDIVSRARVARRTFYTMYATKDECFAEGFEIAVNIVASRMASAVADVEVRDSHALVRTSLQAYLTILADEPVAARALHVETLAAGPAVAEQRARMQSIFASRMRAACRWAIAEGVVAAEPPDEIFDVLIGGIDDRIRACLLGPGAASLPALAPVLTAAALALFTATPGL